jgi:hypothetical protein
MRQGLARFALLLFISTVVMLPVSVIMYREITPTTIMRFFHV